jgi:hypothetical protein
MVMVMLGLGVWLRNRNEECVKHGVVQGVRPGSRLSDEWGFSRAHSPAVVVGSHYIAAGVSQ